MAGMARLVAEPKYLKLFQFFLARMTTSHESLSRFHEPVRCVFFGPFELFGLKAVYRFVQLPGIRIGAENSLNRHRLQDSDSKTI